MFWKKLSRKKRNYLNLLIGGLLVVLIPLALSTFRNPDKAQASWYNDNWAYRKAITTTITSSSSDITNLQTLIIVNTSALISSKLQSSCQDLRFTSQSGSLLPYYIDSGCNSTTTKIWVMADLVPKNTDTYTLYMYYGNPTALTGSDSGKFDNLVGLKGYWPMNESSGATVKDLSITANNGTATGTTVTTHTNFSNARTFPGGAGDTDFVTVSDHANLNPTTQITIEAWVYQAASQSDKQIIIKNMTNGNGGYRLSATTGGKFYINLPTSGFNNVLTTAAYSTSAWHHVVATYDGANMKIYVDGQLDNSVARTGSIGTGDGTTSLYFGRYTNNNTNANLNGNLDEVKIYNTARTAAQVLNDYNNILPNGIAINIASAAVGTSNPSTSFATEEKAPSPVAYWKFDEGTGTTAQDSTSTNADGTISGAAWQSEDQCIAGKCIFFDGSNDVVTVSGTVSGIQTVSFWVRPQSTSEQFIDLNGSAYIQSSSGTVSSTGFTSPTIYVNGVVSSTVTANQWNFVSITTGTAISGSAIKIGQISTNYGQAFIDDVKFYTSARTAAQILTDYNSRGSVKGSSAVIASDPQSNLSNGLVGYWKMDETSGTTTASDSSGNSKTGTSSSSTNVTTGKFANARSFDGSQNIAVSSLNLTGSAVSVSAWIKPNAATVTDFSRIVSTASSGPYSFILAYGSAAGGDQNKMRFLVTTANGAVGSVGTTSLNSTSTWYHVVGVYDGSNSYIYVNGVKEDNDSQAGNLSNTSNNLGIGADYDNTFNFSGNIDEARVYNRALSPAEVSSLYNFAPGPVGYWDFDENTGSSVNDRSGNANTGTWNGTLGNQWKPGKFGSGGSFNRSNNYVKSAASSSALKFGTGDFTVGAWVYFNAVNIGTGANAQSVIRLSYDTGVSADYISAGIFEESGTIYAHSRTSAGAMKAAGNTISAGSWKYVTLVRSSSTLYGYIDGVPMSTTGTTGANFNYSSNGTVFIGGSDDDAGGGTSFLNGKVDDVKIYNYAQTQKQIVSDMNAGHPAVGSPVGSALGHWKFDEGVDNTCSGGTNDTCNSGSQGSTLDGAGSGFASPATNTSGWTNSGKFGKALVFDGNNDYVNLTTNSSTNFGSTNDFTLSTWIYPTTLNTYNTIISRRVNSPSIQGYHLFVRSTGVINFSSFNAGSLVDSLNTDAGIISTNNWYHIVLTHASGGNTTIYVNGVSRLSQTTGSGDFSTSSTSLLVGSQNPATPTDFFTGRIDEVKVYNYALTTSEIALDMNRGSSQVLGSLSDKSTPESNFAAGQEYCVPGDSTSCAAPVGEWKFDENTGISARDTSGNNFTGTLTTGPTWTQGKIGSGVAVSSTNSSYITMGNINKTIYTLSVWFKPQTTITTSAQGGTNNFIIFVDGSGHNADIWLTGGPATGACTDEVMTLVSTLANTRTCSSSITSISPTWNHLVLVWNSTSSRYDMYLNGQLQTVTSGTATHVGLITASAFKMGQRGSTPEFADSYGDFTIDQLRIYDYARSASQIAWEYNRGAPVGYWKFDECQGTIAYDDSRSGNGTSNGNNGTITPGGAPNTAVGTCGGSAATMWADGATGKYNSSLDFDGTDDYISVGSNSILNLSTYTTSFWMKATNASDTSAIEQPFTKNTNAATAASNYVFSWRHTNSTFQKACAHSTSGTFGSQAAKITSTMNAGTWYHITCTYDGTNIKAYLNGNLEATTAASTPDTGNQPLYIGSGYSNGLTAYFNGQMDDVKIYNYALTATQIKTLYSGGAVRFGPVTGSP